ncbi:hypothetical protein CL644_01540 [bacterium]|nr:hypothetical protein [bacterium]|tara:strand:+ start:4187 stop:4855 length:669 start_codon:yes stop_codon:yes gene_type:complete
MNTLYQKTKYKFKLLFTDPLKLLGILISMAKIAFVTKIDTGPEGARGTTDAERDLLQRYAKKAKAGIVEIGVLDGKTTKEMAEVACVPIYGIDPIIPDSMNRRLIGTEEKIVKNLAFYSDFHFFKDFSYNVAKDWHHQFDFIFIDGDHRYESVKKDFEDWYLLIDPGGYISFDDSAKVTSIPSAEFDGWPGCITLVNELKLDSRLRLIETVDSITVFQKIPV